MKKKAVILLSGGLDSATCLAIARDEGYECYCMSFRYGQRHEVELAAAEAIAEIIGAAEHRVVDIDLAAFGGSALTDSSINVPTETGEGIPPTYVPARNTIFLSYALAWAEVIDSTDIFIGVNAVDYSGYPDCRPEYITAYEQMAGLATKAAVEGSPVKIHAPLADLSKAEIILKGTGLGVDYSLTHSCYAPEKEGYACGRCDSCRIRKKGFTEAGIMDPAM